MVEPKIKKWSYFTAFILPCLVLYLLFFITPFFRGIGISLTNWDGLTQKVPMTLGKEEFELKILSRIEKQSDADYVMSVYYLDENDNSYHRRAINGMKKYRLERIIRKTKYEPDAYRFVGLENYKKIFTGKSGGNFYPHTTKLQKYNKSSDLPGSIPRRTFEKEIARRLPKDSEDSALIKKAYSYSEASDSYRLSKEYDEFEITTPLWELAEVLVTKTVSESDIDSFVRNLKVIALGQDAYSIRKAAVDFIHLHSISDGSRDTVLSVADGMLEAGKLKIALSDNWVVKQRNMGVVGFTLFFAFFSVIGINVVAFALALALDTGLHGQKILRTVFFLPNVLSMIIVALIWNMLFVQLLPALTGVEKWISDPNKTPWLLVVVAVWQGAGYYMIVYLAGLQNIPTEIIEAAKIDGATGWQRFRFITLPMMIPALTISLFLTIANALKSFDLMYAMVGPTGYATGTVPLVYDIYFQAYSMKESGMATAKAMVLFLAIVLVTGIQLFLMKRKEVEA
ncbi:MULTISPECIES: sugar ABC transporter permease [Treponema]|nr:MULTISPECIES: sugar ABC transporter permease [Treponema]MCI5644812.1 sugar ABC transporter permease [Treponema porcinum]MDD7125419.1 sugar ABC transporter permease [Treponema porcinum]MDY4467702.1 sugar ABC transporter permease [Treponema porcinum]MDY5454075.1 sugar ABC transporter permease [Treponema porcinum]